VKPLNEKAQAAAAEIRHLIEHKSTVQFEAIILRHFAEEERPVRENTHDAPFALTKPSSIPPWSKQAQPLSKCCGAKAERHLDADAEFLDCSSCGKPFEAMEAVKNPESFQDFVNRQQPSSPSKTVDETIRSCMDKIYTIAMGDTARVDIACECKTAIRSAIEEATKELKEQNRQWEEDYNFSRQSVVNLQSQLAAERDLSFKLAMAHDNIINECGELADAEEVSKHAIEIYKQKLK
jgi:hypothetical protein